MRPLSDQPVLLDRIRAVTVPNHPGVQIRIRHKTTGMTAVVSWVEFIHEYEPTNWVEA